MENIVSVTLQAAVHLGKYYMENLRSTKNHSLQSFRQLFQVTERLIADQSSNFCLITIDLAAAYVERDDSVD